MLQLRIRSQTGTRNMAQLTFFSSIIYLICPLNYLKFKTTSLRYSTYFYVLPKLILLPIIKVVFGVIWHIAWKIARHVYKDNNRKLLIIHCRKSPLLFLLLIKIVKNELYLKLWSSFGVCDLCYPLKSHE